VTDTAMPEQKFWYELECHACGAMHKPMEVKILEGQKTVDFKGNCAKCGKENFLIFHRLKPINSAGVPVTEH
jgi:ribosomal protein L44E